jgi:hypothetical protein
MILTKSFRRARNTAFSFMQETRDAFPDTFARRCGQHHVMSELLRRGYIAALAPQGVPNADIVVCNVEGTQLVSIQVKIARQWFRLSLA